MDANQRYDDTLFKFKQSIKYQNKNKDIASILLFRHYLTNLFQLKRKLGNDSIFIKNQNSHNIFLELNPSWLEELKDLESFYEDLRKYNIKFSTGRFLDGLFIYLFIYWEIYKDTNEIKDLHTENIYFPLIKIIERVNTIYTQNAQFEIGEITFRNAEKYRDFKLPSLNDDFLNYINSKYLLEYGVDIPNQKETNQLWEEFQKSK